LITAIVLVSSLLVGIYSIYYVSPTYEASTKLLINHNERLGSGSQAVDWNTVNTNIMLMNSYKEIIQSEAILNKVAEKHPEYGLTGKMLMNFITAASTPDSQIMTVNVLDGSYERAVSIANAVAEEFKRQIPSIMKVDNVAILSIADPKDPPSQVSPNPPLNVILAFLLASMFSIGLVFLLDYLDDTIKTEADAEKILGLPTLSLIHSIRKDDMTPKSSNTNSPSQQIQTAGDKGYVSINS
jgi:capsular polysaccharide biosynthesis protein